jgi:hypothetical protein
MEDDTYFPHITDNIEIENEKGRKLEVDLVVYKDFCNVITTLRDDEATDRREATIPGEFEDTTVELLYPRFPMTTVLLKTASLVPGRTPRFKNRLISLYHVIFVEKANIRLTMLESDGELHFSIRLSLVESRVCTDHFFELVKDEKCFNLSCVRYEELFLNVAP